MKIRITCDIDDEYSDPMHDMGVTNEGYEAIMRALTSVGADDIDIQQEDEER